VQLQQYIKVYNDLFSKGLLNNIDKAIYNDPNLFRKGQIIGNGDASSQLATDVRSVETYGLSEETIGASVAKRVIYHELIKLTNTIEAEYKKIAPHYDSGSQKTFEFLYYNDDMKGKYDWHVDHGEGVPRSLTILCGLGGDYMGGELQIVNEQTSFKLKQNQVVVFPSNFCYPHRVLPVTEGERKVLVIWTL